MIEDHWKLPRFEDKKNWKKAKLAFVRIIWDCMGYLTDDEVEYLNNQVFDDINDRASNGIRSGVVYFEIYTARWFITKQ